MAKNFPHAGGPFLAHKIAFLRQASAWSKVAKSAISAFLRPACYGSKVAKSAISAFLRPACYGKRLPAMRDRRAGGFARGQVGRCAGPWDGAHDGPRAWAGSRLCVGGLPFVSIAVAVRRLPRLDDAQCAGSQRGPRQWQCSHRGRCQREAARCARAHRPASQGEGCLWQPLAVRAPPLSASAPTWLWERCHWAVASAQAPTAVAAAVWACEGFHNEAVEWVVAQCKGTRCERAHCEQAAGCAGSHCTGGQCGGCALGPLPPSRERSQCAVPKKVPPPGICCCIGFQVELLNR